MSDEYRRDTLPKKSIKASILNAYGSGEPCIEGVEYTAFGRKKEVDRFNQTLKLTANGSGTMEIFIGDYGVGKSFVLALFQNFAVRKGFVVMSSTIDTRSRYFAGSSYDKQGLALYSSLIEGTVIKGKMKGGAFDTILVNWYEELKEITGNNGLAPIYLEFDRLTHEYQHLPMYSDIRAAIFTRFKELNDGIVHSQALEFFSAKFTKKTDAAQVNAKDYIKESTWFNVLNTYSHIFHAAGYKGLIVLIDQVDFLTSLPKITRLQNYETILSMWNQINQNRTEYLSICHFGASNLIYGKNSIESLTPLYDRVKDSYVINTLPSGEMAALLVKLQEIHESFYDWHSGFDEEYIEGFIADVMNGSTLSGNCIRPISKAWVNHLNTIQRGSKSDATDFIDEVKEELNKTEEDGFPIEFQDD